MKKIFSLLFIAAALCTYTSCKTKDTPKPAVESLTKKQIGTARTADSYTVTLYADSNLLFSGYNRVYVTVQDPAGAATNTATVSISPVMTMTSMTHSAPFEQVVYAEAEKSYAGAVIFNMPSTADGSWAINVTVNGRSVSIPVSVTSFPTKIMSSGVGTDNNTYIVSLVRPLVWKVGMNDIELTIHKKVSMMDFPGVDHLSLEMTPEMPSMGHGSPNNISPVSVGNGHYKGKVNYTMTGDWRLHLKLSDGNTVLLADAYIDILF
ncbi:hypothetical protein DBR32_00765 [Taibaiella sp. KBW10]|uniref:FixH family protein n=1 Tax=Taibaiella sp. KBW10 TaxID=2153357 RepID=UPI000F5A3EB8|nr:FixH family protein [Taibaiella sp. KBW10]RQO32179.1 hypothetical protein DBR32_00765 [Taibaiella sp. KBW10]